MEKKLQRVRKICIHCWLQMTFWRETIWAFQRYISYIYMILHPFICSLFNHEFWRLHNYVLSDSSQRLLHYLIRTLQQQDPSEQVSVFCLISQKWWRRCALESPILTLGHSQSRSGCRRMNGFRARLGEIDMPKAAQLLTGKSRCSPRLLTLTSYSSPAPVAPKHGRAPASLGGHLQT